MTRLRVLYVPLREFGRRVDMSRVPWRNALWGCHMCVWGWSLQCPPLTWLFCPGRKGGLKVMLLAPSFLFGVYVPRGVVEGEVFMASRHSWDDFQAACHFDSSAVGRLVVWSTEESYLINRESSPCGCIFLFASLVI